MPTLTIQLPGLPPVEHILREESITLGRMKGNTIALDDVSVSLSHAKITRIGDDYLLKDLNSTNGTMLNGQSINEARLRNGDQLKFGEVVAIFRLEMARPANPSPTPAAPLVATDLPPAAAHTVTGLIPSPRTASVAPKGPAPQPSPQPVQPATQSAPVPVPRSGPAAPRSVTSGGASAGAGASKASRAGKKNLVVWLAPILGGVSAIAVIGFVIWNMVGGNSDSSPPSTSAPAAKVTNAQSAPKPPLAAASKKTNTTVGTNASPTTKPAVTQKVTPPPVAPVVAPTPTSVQTNMPEAQLENASLADLVKALRSPDVATRRRAAQNISSFAGNATDAVPALRAALKDSDAEVRMWSALALVGNQIYDKVTIPILVEALRREDPTIRQTACIALALIPCEGADKALVVPALTVVATKDSREEVRKDALTALRVIAPETIKNE